MHRLPVLENLRVLLMEADYEKIWFGHRRKTGKACGL
jgi:hypothetical protein